KGASATSALKRQASSATTKKPATAATTQGNAAPGNTGIVPPYILERIGHGADHPGATQGTQPAGNTGIGPPYILNRIGHGADIPAGTEKTSRAPRRVFGAAGARRGNRVELETTFTAERGYDPSHVTQAVLLNGSLVNSTQNRDALRNALINGARI